MTQMVSKVNSDSELQYPRIVGGARLLSAGFSAFGLIAAVQSTASFVAGGGRYMLGMCEGTYHSKYVNNNEPFTVNVCEIKEDQGMDYAIQAIILISVAIVTGYAVDSLSKRVKPIAAVAA